MIEIGGVSRFQVLAFFIIESGICSFGYWYFPMGFFIQKPQYKCEFAEWVPEDKYEEICEQDAICSNDERIKSWSIDMDSEKSLNNWY